MATQAKELRPQYQTHPDDPYHLTTEGIQEPPHRLGGQPAPSWPRPDPQRLDRRLGRAHRHDRARGAGRLRHPVDGHLQHAGQSGGAGRARALDDLDRPAGAYRLQQGAAQARPDRLDQPALGRDGALQGAPDRRHRRRRGGRVEHHVPARRRPARRHLDRGLDGHRRGRQHRLAVFEPVRSDRARAQCCSSWSSASSRS